MSVKTTMGPNSSFDERQAAAIECFSLASWERPLTLTGGLQSKCESLPAPAGRIRCFPILNVRGSVNTYRSFQEIHSRPAVIRNAGRRSPWPYRSLRWVALDG